MRREEVRDLDLPTTLCHLDQRMHPVDFSRTKLYKVSTFRRSVFVYFSALNGRSAVVFIALLGGVPYPGSVTNGAGRRKAEVFKSRGPVQPRAGREVLYFSVFFRGFRRLKQRRLPLGRLRRGLGYWNQRRSSPFHVFPCLQPPPI